MKLLEERELCVCELMQVLGMSQPRISRHLGVLKNAGLVNDRREGKWVYYSLQDSADENELQTILDSLLTLENSNPIVLQDKNNLKKAIRLSEVDGPCASCSNPSLNSLS